MSEQSSKTVWGVYGGSTRGSSHLRTGLPNQDSWSKWSAEGGSVAVLAVSDGHGSASHFRSEIGSRMGVDTAVEALRETPIPVPEGHPLVLAESIVSQWRDRVLAHLEAHPFTDQEWAKLPAKDAAQMKAAILANPPLAYGATLLAVLAAESEILYLQLGDGDILVVDDAGRTTRPVPEDHRLIANQTTSLCQKGAAQDFRAAHYRSSDGVPPALILVSSDGYANSFVSDEDFLRLGPDYLELLRQYGAEKVEAQLAKILPEASRKGSGDDITLGFIQRLDHGSKVAGVVSQSASSAAQGQNAPATAAESASHTEAQSSAAAPPASATEPPPHAAGSPIPPTKSPSRDHSRLGEREGADVPPARVEVITQPTPAAAPAAALGQSAARAAAPEPATPKPTAQSRESAPTAATPGRRFGASAEPQPATAKTQEISVLRRKLFWLKVALAGVFVLGLAGAGLSWWHPFWWAHFIEGLRSRHPAPTERPRYEEPHRDGPRTRGRSQRRYRLQNCALDQGASNHV